MDSPTIIDTAPGTCGDLVLRRAGHHYEIIADGMFLMDTRAGESERLLVRAAAARMPGHRLLIGGLGVGISLHEALSLDVRSITVVEREPAVVNWNHQHFGNTAALSDPRVRCLQTDLVSWLATTPERFDALCLDIDNGPDWTLSSSNASLYSAEGLDVLASRLTPGGILTIWSAADSQPFTAALRDRFTHVEVLPVPVPRGEPDVVFLASTAAAIC
ncbi:spermidine synthase [Actinokineospora sp. NBRC 105648]|uniref:spermidine synthase n=1 Tax=Actinokineospora sp. NBRC 105648 TaxID=3032206 RepID=UPI0024A5EB1A|nr:spermidine synthase [Actinokineospora sp. NBRC 105648]GLZ43287.1 spermidine synthase [Actinokineospora sp. NBRC 105648]